MAILTDRHESVQAMADFHRIQRCEVGVYLYCNYSGCFSALTLNPSRKITEWLEKGTLSNDDRRRLQNIQENLIYGKMEYEDLLLDAELRGIRNPSFPGDLIGWLDDDFGLDIYGIEEDDDADDTAKNN